MDRFRQNTVSKGFYFYSASNLSIQKKIIFPFIEFTDSTLSHEGFLNNYDSFEVPANLQDEFEYNEFTNSINKRELVLGLCIFIGSSVGSWAIGKFCDYLWDKKLKPGIEALKKNINSYNPEKPFFFQFGTWYQQDKVYINTDFLIEEINDINQLRKNIVAAHINAKSLISQGNIENKVLNYTICDGKLSPEPVIGGNIRSDIRLPMGFNAKSSKNIPTIYLIDRHPNKLTVHERGSIELYFKDTKPEYQRIEISNWKSHYDFCIKNVNKNIDIIFIPDVIDIKSIMGSVLVAVGHGYKHFFFGRNLELRRFIDLEIKSTKLD